MVVDGPLRQPFSDYMKNTEAFGLRLLGLGFWGFGVWGLGFLGLGLLKSSLVKGEGFRV